MEVSIVLGEVGQMSSVPLCHTIVGINDVFDTALVPPCPTTSSSESTPRRSAPTPQMASPPFGKRPNKLPHVIHRFLLHLRPKYCSSKSENIAVSFSSPDNKAGIDLGAPRRVPDIFMNACTCFSTQFFPPPPPPTLTSATTHCKK